MVSTFSASVVYQVPVEIYQAPIEIYQALVAIYRSPGLRMSNLKNKKKFTPLT